MIGNNKIIITGANGMLGSSLTETLGKKNVLSFSSSDLDITNRAQVKEVLTLIKPNIIIHTAAFTNVELCEIEIEKAYKVNAIGTQNLVDYCIDKSVLFIYISSTGIYGCENEVKPYIEFDDVNPTTIHHKSKLSGEQIVKNHLDKFLILRTGWLYGGSRESHKNFVYKRFLEGAKNSSIFSNPYQIGNPTYVENLVKQIELLISENVFGIFNCVDKAYNVSRYDYVKKIIEYFELPTNVQIAPKDMFKRVAPVSKNESAINFKLDLLNLNIMKDWESSLEEYINILKANE